MDSHHQSTPQSITKDQAIPLILHTCALNNVRDAEELWEIWADGKETIPCDRLGQCFFSFMSR